MLFTGSLSRDKTSGVLLSQLTETEKTLLVRTLCDARFVRPQQGLQAVREPVFLRFQAAGCRSRTGVQ